MGRGFGGWNRIRFARRVLVVRCWSRSERLDFRKFAHSFARRFKARILETLIQSILRDDARGKGRLEPIYGIAELLEEAPLALLFKVDNPMGKKNVPHRATAQ